VFPALPRATDGFVLLKSEPMRELLLGLPDRKGGQTVTWEFVLRDVAGNCTRLITRVRGSDDYRFQRLPPWLGLPLVRFVHFLMERKQLIGIANRVERSPGFAHANLG